MFMQELLTLCYLIEIIAVVKANEICLPHRFIENNKIASISPFAFRGLKALIHL